MSKNDSEIPIFYSKSELTNILIDYSNVYFLPAICLFGMITSLFNIIVTFSRDLEKNVFKFILVDSIGDFLFLLIQFFLVIIRCGTLCPWGYSYIAKLYEIYIYLFLGYVIIAFRVLVDLSVSLNRLLILSNIFKNSKEFNFYVKMIIFFIIAVLLNLAPFALSKEVGIKGLLYPERNSTYFEVLYDKKVRESFKASWTQITLSCIAVIKDPVLFTTFCAINIAIAVKFRQHMNKKSGMTLKNMIRTTVTSMSQETSLKQVKKPQSSKKENSTTLMILGLCVIYFFGNIIDSSAIILDIFQIDVYYQYVVIVVLGNTLLFLSHSLNFFVYYFFNQSFRKRFKKLFFFWRR